MDPNQTNPHPAPETQQPDYGQPGQPVRSPVQPLQPGHPTLPVEPLPVDPRPETPLVPPPTPAPPGYIPPDYPAAPVSPPPPAPPASVPAPPPATPGTKPPVPLNMAAPTGGPVVNRGNISFPARNTAVAGRVGRFPRPKADRFRLKNIIVEKGVATAKLSVEDSQGLTTLLPEGVIPGWSSSDARLIVKPAADGLSAELSADANSAGMSRAIVMVKATLPDGTVLSADSSREPLSVTTEADGSMSLVVVAVPVP